MSNSKHLRILAASTLLAALSAAHAAPLTYHFSGKIGSIENAGSGFNLTELAAGDSFTGSFTFESTTPDGDPDGTFGFYTGGAFEFASNGMVSSCAACASMLVENDNPNDALYLGARPTGGATFGSSAQLGFAFEIRYPGQAVLGGEAFPLNLSPTSFSYGRLIVFPEVCDGCTQAYASLSSFAGAVPEPGTYALMLAGLSAVGLMAKRRKA